jgi:hypothetical protein
MVEGEISPSWDDFADRIGASFTMEVEGGHCDVVLEQAGLLSQSLRPGGSFRLAFRGPGDPIYPQAIYSLRAPGFDCEIFLVPIARDDKGTLYEAIFN